MRSPVRIDPLLAAPHDELMRGRSSARNVASASSPGTPSQSSMGYVAGGPIVRDTVNDALPFPTPHKPHGSYHWAFERLLSAALVPATAAAFVVSPTAYPTLDALLGVSLVMHSHIGVRVRVEITEERS
jgi:succinate dehydrogenase (ubiquinone) membrane anchor subunit